jgi:hypothetical protein
MEHDRLRDFVEALDLAALGTRSRHASLLIISKFMQDAWRVGSPTAR